MTGKDTPMVNITGLEKRFGPEVAVHGVNLSVAQGEFVTLLGPSGCGKTTLGRCILRIIEPTLGAVHFQPQDEVVDIVELDKKELRAMRRFMQMVFQDPYASLDPRMTVFDIVGEALVENGLARGETLRERVAEVVDAVGLETKHLKRYPHAFSDGQGSLVERFSLIIPTLIHV